ncbi:MAG: DUF6152 family protein [Arenicellaceae bacterium]|nr:DUF6152 family protein [Arenicellaceae bacterium]
MNKYILIPLVAFIFAGAAMGHHSDSALDMRSVATFEGVVVEYTLRNPHSYFVVEATSAEGETTSWEVQMGSALSMSRRGWAVDTLSMGDRVEVGVHPARNGRQYGLLASLVSNGAPISYQRLSLPKVERGATTFEGVWTASLESLGADYPGGLDQLMIRDLTLTEKGRLASEAFDQDSLENPELSCITKPTPGGLVYTDRYPLEIEFTDGGIIMIRVQYFDQERTVYMDGREHPPVTERTHEGHSIGWWENDTLVVDTTNFADDRSPYQNGTPSGAHKHVVERYRLLEGGTHMELQFTLEDPEYIVGSMSHTRTLRYSPEVKMTPFNCDLEATRRYLPSTED